MGEWLAERKPLPAEILSSDARRAVETARGLVRSLPRLRERIRLTPELYLADASSILHSIRTLDPTIETVLILAHNPGISDAAVLLTGDEEPAWMPTAAIAVIDFDVDDWKEIGKDRGTLRYYLTPKSLERERKEK